MSLILPEHRVTGADPLYPCPLPVPDVIRRDLVVLYPEYWSTDQMIRVGQLVVHKAIEGRIQKGFAQLCAARFPIANMVPIVAYDWNDEHSMAANNTSAFNHRNIAGTNRLSLHGYGLAFDLNPLWNPCRLDGVWKPEGARFDPRQPGALEVWVVQLWEDMGFDWGGRWTNPLDMHHFQMALSAL